MSGLTLGAYMCDPDHGKVSMEAVVRAMGISVSPETRPGRDGRRRKPSRQALGAGSADPGMNVVYGRNRDRFHTRRSTVIGIRHAVRLPATADRVPLDRVARSGSRLATEPVTGPFKRSRRRIPCGPHQAGAGGEATGQRRRWCIDRATVIEDGRRATPVERGQGRGADSVPAAPAERANA